jgi:hypothetical protein
MVGKLAGGLVALGLIGGAGALAYDDGGTTKATVPDTHVIVTDKQGRTETVAIAGDDGRLFSCPDGIDAKLEPIDKRAGGAKLKLRRVTKRINAIEKRYPEGKAPGHVVDRYNGLVDRHRRLVKAYNHAVDAHNAVLKADCDPQ